MSVVSDFVSETYGCLVQACTAPGFPTPAQIVLRPGIQVEPDLGISQDQCCAGYAYLRLMNVRGHDEPTRQSPLGTPISPCGMPSVAVQVEVGIFRCAPVGDVNFGPQEADWNTAFGTMMADYAALWNTLCCVRELFANRNETWSIIFNEYAPMEVNGGCFGGRLQFTAEVECPDSDCG